MLKRFSSLTLLLFFIFQISTAQEIQISKIEPPNWWAGMKWNKIQLMIYGENLDNISASFNSPDLRISTIHQIENKTYAFIDVEIAPNLIPGKYDLTISKDGKQKIISYSILKREKSDGKFQGFNQKDILYLITPDRYSNGDQKNDNVDGLKEGLNRSNPYGRHGGDIQGLINHLPYFTELGVTALWINPLVENNGNASYHGYAVTDLYQIDARFGNNELYKKLVSKAHENGLKIILDHVNNHIGINHNWIKNLPMPDWINGSVEQHLRATHAKEALNDIYGDKKTQDTEVTGWFSNEMPDMNQRNPYVEKYLIQNTLWWIEFSGLDGIREDTYPYTFPDFSEKWNSAILDEYPDFNVVGEVWIQNPVYLAPYQKGEFYPTVFDTKLPSITDFGLYQAFRDVIEKEQIWPLYECLTKDFLYTNPNNLVTFLDNHDIVRIVKTLDHDPERIKFFLQLLLVTRGIPQLFYGTEIGLIGGNDHGRLRQDFPGGFPDDKRNAFNKSDRTDDENDLFEFTKQMISLRKNHSALSSGKTTHFPPKDEIYVFVKSDKTEQILCVANNKSTNQLIYLGRYSHLLNGAVSLKNLKTNQELPFSENIELEIPGSDVGIYLVQRK